MARNFQNLQSEIKIKIIFYNEPENSSRLDQNLSIILNLYQGGQIFDSAVRAIIYKCLAAHSSCKNQMKTVHYV